MNAQKHLIKLLISNPIDRQLLSEFLHGLGYEVNHSPQLTKEEWPLISLIVVDAPLAQQMQGDLRLIKQHSGPVFLPIIVCLPQKVESFIWLQNGFDEILRLPLVKAELASRLLTLLKLREETESQFNLIYQHLPLGIYRMTEDFKITHANPAFLKILGYSSMKQVLNKPLSDINPSLANEHQSPAAEIKNSDQVIEHESTCIRQDGSHINLKESTLLFRNTDTPPYLVGIIEDITERKKIEDELKFSEEKFRKLVDLSPYGIIIELNETIAFANRAALKLFGAAEDSQLINTPLLARVNSAYQEVLKNRLKFVKEHQLSTEVIEDKFLDLQHNELDIEVIAAPFLYKDQKATQLILNNITERVRYEKKILQMAYYDPLTELANRIKLEEDLSKEILLHKDNSKFIVLMLLDIDDFKKANDTFGHDVGDLLLKEFAKRLQKLERKNIGISRIGGDEFVITISNLSDPQTEAKKIGDEIMETMRACFMLNTSKFFITTSIGISIFPLNGINCRTLLKNADIAMYNTKKGGGNGYQFCTPALTMESDTKTYLEIELREAIASNQLFMHYQPKLSLASNRVVGAEALLRWDHPIKGKIPPITFVPLAEATGLITNMTMMAIRQACQHIHAWQQAKLPEIRIAINLSTRDFRQQDLEKNITAILHEYNINPHLIEFEITESILMEDVQRTAAAINYFKNLGIHISIDDFGTGYSSLNYLKNLHCNSLKIDQTFIRELSPEVLDTSIITSIIDMAHQINMEVVAEGVETAYQYQFLKDNHCDQIQGYLLSQPLAGEDFRAFILNHPSTYSLKTRELA